MGSGVLICRACGNRWYSAAAEQMALEDAACPSCSGGPLELLQEETESGQTREEGNGP